VRGSRVARGIAGTPGRSVLALGGGGLRKIPLGRRFCCGGSEKTVRAAVGWDEDHARSPRRRLRRIDRVRFHEGRVHVASVERVFFFVGAVQDRSGHGAVTRGLA